LNQDNLLFEMKCCYCHKNIKIEIPKKYSNLIQYNIFSCNTCIPENSPIRNGIDEITFTEVKH